MATGTLLKEHVKEYERGKLDARQTNEDFGGTSSNGSGV